MIKILIADDHELVRARIKEILLEGFPSVHIEEAVDCPSLVEKSKLDNWDIIVSDLSMPGGGGIEALRLVRLNNLSIPFLFLSINEQNPYGSHALAAGASGFLQKNRVTDELVNAVKAILSAGKYISPGN